MPREISEQFIAKMEERKRRGDERSWIVRKLLELNQTDENFKDVFEATLKAGLQYCYPELFVLEGEQLSVNNKVSHRHAVLIEKALGMADHPSSAIDIARFSVDKLQELYTVDKNPIWLALIDALPVRTQADAEVKITNCIRIAKAFQEGAQSKVRQDIRRTIQGATGQHLVDEQGKLRPDQQGKIWTPNIEVAINGAYSTALYACDLARRYPEHRAMVETVLLPKKTSSTSKSSLVGALASTAALGDWLQQNVENDVRAEFTDAMDSPSDKLKKRGGMVDQDTTTLESTDIAQDAKGTFEQMTGQSPEDLITTIDKEFREVAANAQHLARNVFESITGRNRQDSENSPTTSSTVSEDSPKDDTHEISGDKVKEAQYNVEESARKAVKEGLAKANLPDAEKLKETATQLQQQSDSLFRRKAPKKEQEEKRSWFGFGKNPGDNK